MKMGSLVHFDPLIATCLVFVFVVLCLIQSSIHSSDGSVPLLEERTRGETHQLVVHYPLSASESMSWRTPLYFGSSQ